MKPFKLIKKFLFGRSPNIFDENGNVRHQLNEETWKAWDERYGGEDYSWQHHKGFEYTLLNDFNINHEKKKNVQSLKKVRPFKAA